MSEGTVQIILTPRLVVWCLERMTDAEADELHDYAIAGGGDEESYVVRTSQFLIAKFGLLPEASGFRD